MASFNNISIIGLGLIGSSIARAVKKFKASKVISAYDLNTDTINRALELGVIDKGFNQITEAVSQSDLIIICSPIGTYEKIIHKIAPHITENAILTDVGSVKEAVINIILPKIKDKGNFVPAHPIAGSEKSGLMEGDAELFIDKEFIITPTHESNTSSIAKISLFWQTLGSYVKVIPPDEHDEIYAKSSHIPHLLSFCYANLLKNHLNKNLREITNTQGDEFASFIRLAFSSPQMWTDIFLFNKEHIINNVKQYFLTKLDILVNLEDIDELYKRMNKARESRERFISKNEFKKNLDQENMLTGILPLLIAYLSIESVEGHPRIGGGFLGMTSIILNLNDDIKLSIYKNPEIYKQTIKLFINEIEKIISLINNSEKGNIQNYLSNTA
jgi:cyclohexadieny/prephenate dehydrogenase